MSVKLDEIAPFDDDGAVRAVVEAPKGAGVKLAYDPELRVFTVSRALPTGITYPFDWGFIPGTLAADGDPVDALVLHHASTYPGVVLTCKALGMIEIDERAEEGGRRTNNRVILLPTWNDLLGPLEQASKLPKALRKEIEQFFLDTTFFTAKDARCLGWHGPKATLAFIRKSRRD